MLVIHRLLRLGEWALLLLREGTLQGQVEVLIRMVALVVERRLVLHLVVVLHRVVDVVRAGVLHLAVDVVPLRHSALLPDQRRTNPTQDVLHSTRRGIFQTSLTRPTVFIR